jgi:hypothetical protein
MGQKGPGLHAAFAREWAEGAPFTPDVGVNGQNGPRSRAAFAREWAEIKKATEWMALGS